MGKLSELAKSAEKAVEEMDKFKKEAKAAKSKAEQDKLLKMAEGARKIAKAFLDQIKAEQESRQKYVLNVIDSI